MDDRRNKILAAEIKKARHDLEICETVNRGLRVELHTTKQLAASFSASNLCLLQNSGTIKTGHLEELRKMDVDLESKRREIESLRYTISVLKSANKDK